MSRSNLTSQARTKLCNQWKSGVFLYSLEKGFLTKEDLNNPGIQRIAAAVKGNLIRRKLVKNSNVPVNENYVCVVRNSNLNRALSILNVNFDTTFCDE